MRETGHEAAFADTLMGGARLHRVRCGPADGVHMGTVTHFSGSTRICAVIRKGRKSETKLRCRLQDKHPESPPGSPHPTGMESRPDSKTALSCPGAAALNLWWWVTVTRMACASRQKRTSVTRRRVAERLVSCACTRYSGSSLRLTVHCKCII
jgi:hypothetical protein